MMDLARECHVRDWPNSYNRNVTRGNTGQDDTHPAERYNEVRN